MLHVEHAHMVSMLFCLSVMVLSRCLPCLDVDLTTCKLYATPGGPFGDVIDFSQMCALHYARTPVERGPTATASRMQRDWLHFRPQLLTFQNLS